MQRIEDKFIGAHKRILEVFTMIHSKQFKDGYIVNYSGNSMGPYSVCLGSVVPCVSPIQDLKISVNDSNGDNIASYK